MAAALPETMLAVKSSVGADKTWEMGLFNVPLPEVKEGEVLVRVEAAPINPSDMFRLLARGDVTKATTKKSDDGLTVVTAPIPDEQFPMVAMRAGQPGMFCGNEGAGVVVGPEGHPLMGKVVGVIGGEMFAQYRAIPADKILPFPEGVTPKQGASWFVNPLTALGMIEYMKLDGHKAIIHTAAASQLGQMLAKACTEQNIPLIGIVRRDEHVELLKGLGVSHPLNMKSETFFKDLVAAIAETGATVAFDALGGGTLVAQILAAMEAGLKASGVKADWYGTDVFKQIYVYGLLDSSPLTFSPSWLSAGFNWSLGGFFLGNVMKRVGPQRGGELYGMVAKGITTTYSTSYTSEVSLEEMCVPETIQKYHAQKTGEKYLVNPSKL